ncbi:hypothetical protein AB0900_30955 [Streptomyces cellulosae]
MARTTARNTPAKKTTARKTAAKKTTTRKTAQARTTPAKKTQPRLSLVKPTPEQPRLSLVKNPTPTRTTDLPLRPRPIVGPLGINEQAAVRAALAAAATRLPVPVRTWNGSTAQLADGVLLIHNPGPDRTFTAHVACRHGAIHGYPIRNLHDLREARALTHACGTNHTVDGDWDQAITHGVRPMTAPAVKVSRLADALTTAKKATADTQPMNTAQIAAGLAARQNTDNTAKEHPQP